MRNSARWKERIEKTRHLFRMNECWHAINFCFFFYTFEFLFEKKYLHSHSDAKAIIMGYLNMRTEMQHTQTSNQIESVFFFSFYFILRLDGQRRYDRQTKEKRNKKERVFVCKISFKGSLYISETFHRLVYIHTIVLCDDIFVHRPSASTFDSTVMYNTSRYDYTQPTYNRKKQKRNKSKLNVPIQLGM